MIYKLVLDKKYIDKTLYYDGNTIAYYCEIDLYSDDIKNELSFYDPTIKEYLDYSMVDYDGNILKCFILLKTVYENQNKTIYCILENPAKSNSINLMYASSPPENYFTVSNISSGNLAMTFTVWDKTTNSPVNNLGEYTRINTKLIADDSLIDPSYAPRDSGRDGIWRQEITAAEYLDVDALTVIGDYEVYSYDVFEYQDNNNFEVLPTKLNLKDGVDTLVEEILDSGFSDADTYTINSIRDALMVYFKYVAKGNAEVSGNEQKFIFKNVAINTNFYESKSDTITRNDTGE